ncbi:MAG: hypothetical protein JOY51_05780 [Nevskia sp.]|nr:hypothetical protein [Nevskia sp.]
MDSQSIQRGPAAALLCLYMGMGGPAPAAPAATAPPPPASGADQVQLSGAAKAASAPANAVAGLLVARAVPPWAANLDLSKLQTVVPDQTIRDKRGNVIYQGAIDLTATLQRIKAGQPFPSRDDGTEFHNFPPPGQDQPSLPARPAGYYHEYVHPTPQEAGPGPQRLVIGLRGEVYYTPDHYSTFIQLNK